MNKVCKVIWSHVKAQWIVVSEVRHNRVRPKQVTLICGLVAATLLIPGVSYADNLLLGTNQAISGDNHTVIGDEAIAKWEENTVVGKKAIADGVEAEDGKNTLIGSKSRTSGRLNIAVGYEAGIDSGSGSNSNTIVIGTHARIGKSKKIVNQSIAIGSGRNRNEGAWAEGQQSISIGANTHARGDSSIAIGGDDVNDAVKHKQIEYIDPDGNKKKAIIRTAFKDLTGIDILVPEFQETQADNAAIAIGMKAKASDMSIGLGTLAQAVGVNTVAIGSGAKSVLTNAIAIGGGAIADENSKGTKQTQVEIGRATYVFSGGANTLEGDIVSFGSKGYERQLKNIAAGEISPLSRDGINGSQLHGILTGLTTYNYLTYAGDDGAKHPTKIVHQSLDKNQLNLRGGGPTDIDKLSTGNISVIYGAGYNKSSLV